MVVEPTDEGLEDLCGFVALLRHVALEEAHVGRFGVGRESGDGLLGYLLGGDVGEFFGGALLFDGLDGFLGGGVDTKGSEGDETHLLGEWLSSVIVS